MRGCGKRNFTTGLDKAPGTREVFGGLEIIVGGKGMLEGTSSSKEMWCPLIN